MMYHLDLRNALLWLSGYGIASSKSGFSPRDGCISGWWSGRCRSGFVVVMWISSAASN